MQGAITINDVSWFLAQLIAIATLAGLVWRPVNNRIALAEAKASKAIEELQTYKTFVAETYARNGYIKDVETRLMAKIETMDGKLDQLLLTKHNANHGG